MKNTPYICVVKVTTKRNGRRLKEPGGVRLLWINNQNAGGELKMKIDIYDLRVPVFVCNWLYEKHTADPRAKGVPRYFDVMPWKDKIYISGTWYGSYGSATTFQWYWDGFGTTNLPRLVEKWCRRELMKAGEL